MCSFSCFKSAYSFVLSLISILNLLSLAPFLSSTSHVLFKECIRFYLVFSDKMKVLKIPTIVIL